MFNCLLCGVGGQGTVLASKLIALASMEKGLSVKTAETIGMAQRGGCVVSHVRAGDQVFSPMIPKKRRISSLVLSRPRRYAVCPI